MTTTPTVRLASLEPLVRHLRSTGFAVIGPTVRDGAIVLAELAHADRLPHGWGVETGPGSYRLRARDDRAAFGHAAGPQAWKRFLHPPREAVLTATRDGRFIEPEPDTTRYAFLGVRPCDLRAIAIQDRVLGVGATYADRRRGVFLVAVNCTEPAATCFCVSAGGGPRAEAGYDLALTELVDADGEPYYLATAGSDAGGEVLAALPRTDADPSQVVEADALVRAAADRMGRFLPEGDLRALLAGSAGSDRWDEVAGRCLTCGNCTMVCPTCYCTSVTDTTDLTGDHAQRWRHWTSCFDTDFSYLHGGPVRASASSRYRQWLSHKLGTWHDQWGESGCVGCGRCVAWCPVGIDITAEAAALAAEQEARS
jgi:ferredoxin